ncbi:MAG: hypothetical protein AUK34_00365 [Ignavibacteria bacterium CG2_30_36_16]|nr:hypothetical protein [Ignavibacteria bacterium]OIP64097.1 MAG: hypothetical protein AUK34_00365 [Ignavibacteria bacterium CG2_30_36_16]
MKIFGVILIFSAFVFAQSEKLEKKGVVTYLSSQNVYVKFDDTEGIAAGDTLFVKENSNYKPVLVVNFISSRSAAGETIKEGNLKVGDAVFVFAIVVKKDNDQIQDSIKQLIDSKIPEQKLITPDVTVAKVPVKSSTYKGRFSIQSYSNLSNLTGSNDYQRWRYTFSFNADNISGSNFSVSNYMSFAYKANEWGILKHNYSKSLRIYDLAVKYNFNETTLLWFGRHLNRKITNISSVDGLQFEKYFGSLYTGAIVGSRPDFSNLGFNLKLFEYGAYIGKTDSINGRPMENTLAAVEQTNNLNTDRRFVYFQHTNDILPSINIFFTSEVDLYKREKGIAKSDFSFTGIFLSARFSPVRDFSISLSYDARKNVIYYETFKSFTDSLIENETRQGFRIRTTIRPFNKLMLGLSAGYRFRKSDVKPSRNFSGYLSYSQIPVIQTSSTISYNKILSSYVDGNIYGINFTKYIPFAGINLSAGFRKTIYKFSYNSNSLEQNNINVDASARIIENIFFSLGYEGIFEKEKTYGRILFDVSTRF